MRTRRAFARRMACGGVRHALFVAAIVVAWPVLAETGPAPRVPATPTVGVRLPGCAGGSFPAAAFLDSLRVELAGQPLACCAVVAAGGDGGAGDLRVTLDVEACSAGSDKILAVVRDTRDGRSVAREIGISDVAEAARPRALALAVAELLRGLGQPPQTQVTPAPAAQLGAAPPAPAQTTRASRFSLGLAGQARVLPARATTVWGGRAWLTVVPWRNVHADVDVGGGAAWAESDLGTVALRTASVGVGVGPRFATSRADVDLGLHAELGWAWVHGDPLSAQVHGGSGSGLISSAGLRAAVALPASTRIRSCLALEGGGVLQGVQGQSSGRTVLGMTGYYLLIALGMEVRR